MQVATRLDVLARAWAPEPGARGAGGGTRRGLLAGLRGSGGVNLVGADVVEVSPVYDHAEITAVAAANVGYELVTMMATGPR